MLNLFPIIFYSTKEDLGSLDAHLLNKILRTVTERTQCFQCVKKKITTKQILSILKLL